MPSNKQSSPSRTTQSQQRSRNQPQTLDENTSVSPIMEQAFKVIDKHREIRATMEARHREEMREQTNHFQKRIKQLEELLETGFEATLFELHIKSRDKILASKREHCENTQTLIHNYETQMTNLTTTHRRELEVAHVNLSNEKSRVARLKETIVHQQAMIEELELAYSGM